MPSIKCSSRKKTGGTRKNHSRWLRTRSPSSPKRNSLRSNPKKKNLLNNRNMSSATLMSTTKEMPISKSTLNLWSTNSVLHIWVTQKCYESTNNCSISIFWVQESGSPLTHKIGDKEQPQSRLSWTSHKTNSPKGTARETLETFSWHLWNSPESTLKIKCFKSITPHLKSPPSPWLHQFVVMTCL